MSAPKCVFVYVCVCLTPVHQSQQEKIDSIEDNVNTAAANVEEGTRSLGKVCMCLCVLTIGCMYVCGVWEMRRSMALCLPAIPVFVPIDPLEYRGKLQLRK